MIVESKLLLNFRNYVNDNLCDIYCDILELLLKLCFLIVYFVCFFGKYKVLEELFKIGFDFVS